MRHDGTTKKSGAVFFLAAFGGCGAIMMAAGFLGRRVEGGLLVGGAVSMLVGLLGSIVFAMSYRSASSRDLRLLSTGSPGMARILDIARTGLAERNAGYDIGIAFDLLVNLPGRQAYKLKNYRQMVPDIHIPAIQPGMSVRVFVHPDRDDELIIDFSSNAEAI